jgi:hypothetical protein
MRLSFVVTPAVLAVVLGGGAHAEEPCNTVTIEPVSLAMMRTLSAQYERHVLPQLGIAGLVGVGSSTNVSIGDRIHNYSVGPSFDKLEDVRYGRVHIGVQGNYYAERFRGLHAGAEVVYVHFGWASPDAESINAISASAYGGWKWLWNNGITIVVQAGLGVVETDADVMTGWHVDRDGTLGPVHLAANASFGYSF